MTSMVRTRSGLFQALVLNVLLCLGSAWGPVADALELQPRHAFTVRDSIEWKRVLPFSATTSGFGGGVALISPDGARFILHTRHGNMTRNANVDTLLLFSMHEVERYVRAPERSGAPAPVVLVSRDAYADEDILTDVQWLDNAAVGFVAKGSNGKMQGFVFDIAAGTSQQVTASDSDAVAFARANGRVAYYACISATPSEPLVVLADSIETMIPRRDGAPSCYPTTPIELFVQGAGEQPKRVDLRPMTMYPQLKRIWLAPSGDHAIIVAPATNAPSSWVAYEGPDRERFGFTEQWVRDDPTSMDLLSRTRYLVVDMRAGTVRPLLDAPTGQMSLNYTPVQAFWRRESDSVVVSNTYLPLSGVDDTVSAQRAHQPAIAEVEIATGKVALVAWETARHDVQVRVPNPIVDLAWRAGTDQLTVTHQRAADGAVSRERYSRVAGVWTKQLAEGKDVRSRQIAIEEIQSLNERPRIFAMDRQSQRKKLLFDPNPEAKHASFASASVFKWRDQNGREWTGGLLLPPGSGRERRPLVVQTHGFNASQFLLDGPTDALGGGTVYAAQSLASAGFVVLQVEDHPDTITEDVREGPAVAEGLRAGIEKLIADGIAERSKIGLVAFSRTGWHALHLVAKYPDMLAAIEMADTLSIGYVPLSFHATNPSIAAELWKMTGGRPNLETIGTWFRNNPLYALARSNAAVRLEGMGSGLGMWETYALLREAGRPVEFVVYPDGSHVLQKPQERLASQGGTVDWFRFWLQGFEDDDPSKSAQYERWRQLRSAAAR